MQQTKSVDIISECLLRTKWSVLWNECKNRELLFTGWKSLWSLATWSVISDRYIGEVILQIINWGNSLLPSLPEPSHFLSQCSLKQKGHHFDEIVSLATPVSEWLNLTAFPLAGYTRNYHFGHFQCSQWRNIYGNDICKSVLMRLFPFQLKFKSASVKWCFNVTGGPPTCIGLCSPEAVADHIGYGLLTRGAISPAVHELVIEIL